MNRILAPTNNSTFREACIMQCCMADPKRTRWAGMPIEFEFKIKKFAPPKYENAKNTASAKWGALQWLKRWMYMKTERRL